MTSELIADQQWFRSSDGKSLLAGSPLTSFTVSEAGAQVLNAIENGDALPTNHASLTSRLLAKGAIHPLTDLTVPSSEITVVIPAFITDNQGHQQLTSLVSQLSDMSVIVVDDFSPIPIHISNVTVIRRENNGGPGAARNTGVQQVTTNFVAFVDADVRASGESLRRLASLLRDETIALVAPRIATENEKTFLSEYESLRSPLDLGAEPAVVRPLSRVSYVPSAVLVGRTSQLKEQFSFDESMRLGEDVDLVWRIVESGLIVRYVPSVVCQHLARTSWSALLKQRFGYGSSAATLNSHHRRAASPLRANLVLLLPGAALLAGYLYFAVLLALPMYFYFATTLQGTGISLRQRVNVTTIGFKATVRLLASAVRRAWWPIFALSSLVFQPMLFVMLFSVLAAPAYGIVKQKPRFPGEYFIMRILDDCAYGLGVWAGAIRTRKFGCLLPVITLRRSSPQK
ncbi:MAG: mycofactocin system glycosyltransferase [Actinomycetota bacterium]|jgi:mycofactocin system glycosyltransferase